MFIYTVKPGDSLFSIAAKYQVSRSALGHVNGWTESEVVPGQTLIVPSTTYIVQPGDSIWLISQMSFLPVQTLRTVNGLHHDDLQAGTKLRLPPHPKYAHEGLSYLIPETADQTEAAIRFFAPYHAYFAIFEYHIMDAAGTLSTLNDEAAIRASRSYRIAPLATISNAAPGAISPAVTRQILGSPEARNRLINHILTLVRSKHYAGVNINFERISAEERDLYSAFLHALRDRLKPDGYYTSAAVPVKRNDAEHPGYDYGGIDSAVDFVFIMAYDFHEVHTPPGPVAPIDEIRKTLDYTIRHVNRSKMILGVSRYGYDWTMTDGSGAGARAVSVADAIGTALRYKVPIQYSAIHQQPFYTYRDESGTRHVVWFEDARSRAAKFQLVSDYRLRGVGARQLDLNFPQPAYLASQFFTEKKVL